MKSVVFVKKFVQLIYKLFLSASPSHLIVSYSLFLALSLSLSLSSLAHAYIEIWQATVFDFSR